MPVTDTRTHTYLGTNTCPNGRIQVTYTRTNPRGDAELRILYDTETACQANSTFAPGQSSIESSCTPNEGYKEIQNPDGSWAVVPDSTPQCSAWTMWDATKNECTPMQCDEGTYWSGTLQQCTARDPIAGCNSGDPIALTVTKGGTPPATQSAYGCNWALDTEIPEGNRIGCVQTPDGEQCTAWYTNTGTSAQPNACEQNPHSCEQPYPGSGGSSGGSNPGGNPGGDFVTPGDSNTPGGGSNGSNQGDATDGDGQTDGSDGERNDLLDDIVNNTHVMSGQLDDIRADLRNGDGTVNVQQSGQFYTPSDRTFSGVLSDFIDQASQAPFISAANGFFEIDIAQQTCPVWETSVDPLGNGQEIPIVIDQLCGEIMNTIWPIIRGILFIVAGFVAFRWAFL